MGHAVRAFVLVAACACSPPPSTPVSPFMSVSRWADGAKGATCASRLRIEYPADPNGNESIVLQCDDRGAMLHYDLVDQKTKPSTLHTTEHATAPAVVEQIWKSALAHVTDAECHTREEAKNGKRIPVVPSYVSLGYGGHDIGCAASPAWDVTVAALRAQVPAPRDQ